MATGKRLTSLLADWYKPTKRGEQARKYLMDHASEIISEGVGEMGEAGAIGEEADNVKPKKSNRKKGKSKNAGSAKK